MSGSVCTCGTPTTDWCFCCKAPVCSACACVRVPARALSYCERCRAEMRAPEQSERRLLHDRVKQAEVERDEARVAHDGLARDLAVVRRRLATLNDQHENVRRVLGAYCDESAVNAAQRALEATRDAERQRDAAQARLTVSASGELLIETARVLGASPLEATADAARRVVEERDVAQARLTAFAGDVRGMLPRCEDDDPRAMLKAELTRRAEALAKALDRRGEALAELQRLKERDAVAGSVREVLGASPGETTRGAAERVMKALEDARSGACECSTAFSAIRSACSAADETTLDAVLRVVQERDARSRLLDSVRKTLGVLAASDIPAAVQRLVEERGRACSSAAAASMSDQVTLQDLARAVAERDEARRLLADERAEAARVKDVLMDERDAAQRHLSSWEHDAVLSLTGSDGREHVLDAVRRVVAERNSLRKERGEARRKEALRGLALSADGLEQVRLTLGATASETVLVAARRVVAERDDARKQEDLQRATTGKWKQEALRRATAVSERDGLREQRDAAEQALATARAERDVAREQVLTMRAVARSGSGPSGLFTEFSAIRDVLGACSSESVLDAAKRVVADSQRWGASLRDLDLARRALGAKPGESAEAAAQCVMASLASVLKERDEAWQQEALRRASVRDCLSADGLEQVRSTLGATSSESVTGAARRVVAERATLRDQIGLCAHELRTFSVAQKAQLEGLISSMLSKHVTEQ